MKRQEEKDKLDKAHDLKKRFRTRKQIRKELNKEKTESTWREYDRKVKHSTDQFYMNTLVNPLQKVRSSGTAMNFHSTSRANNIALRKTNFSH